MHDKTLQLSLTLCDPMDCSPPDSSVRGILVHGKSTGVGCHYRLQGIFPAQRSNLCLLHLLPCRPILYHELTWETLGSINVLR